MEGHSGDDEGGGGSASGDEDFEDKRETARRQRSDPKEPTTVGTGQRAFPSFALSRE